MRAAVPEELQHLDLALGLDRLLRPELGVVDAGLGPARLRIAREGRKPERGHQRTATKVHA